MLEKTILLTALAAALTAPVGTPAATFSIFNDESAWNERVVNRTTVDFGSTRADGLGGIESSTGIGHIGSKPGAWWQAEPQDGQDIGGAQGAIDNSQESQWRDVLTKNSNSRTTIRFDSTVTSFGAEFDLFPASIGTGIWMTFKHNDKELAKEEVYFSSAQGRGFWGIVFSDQVFDEIVMTAGSRHAIKETFAMNYMMYGAQSLTGASQPRSESLATPLPGALWMFVSALVGMTFIPSHYTEL